MLQYWITLLRRTQLIKFLAACDYDITDHYPVKNLIQDNYLIKIVITVLLDPLQTLIL